MIDEPEYGAAAKGFHWLTALLLAVQFGLGWIMPNIGRGMQPESLMNLHLSIGVVILAAALARAAWRLVHGVPAPEASLPAWQERMAQALHGLLYLLIFALVLTGWSYASMRGWTVTIFGLRRSGCTWRRRSRTSSSGATASCSACCRVSASETDARLLVRLSWAPFSPRFLRV